MLFGAGCSGVAPVPASSPTSVTVPSQATSTTTGGTQSVATSSSETTVVWKTYTNSEHGFQVKYPDSLKTEEVLAKDVGIPKYLAFRLTSESGNQFQIYVNPGGHGSACMNPGDPTDVPKQISQIIGGVKAIGETCSSGATEAFSFTHNGDEFEILLQGNPADQKLFHEILKTFVFTTKR